MRKMKKTSIGSGRGTKKNSRVTVGKAGESDES